MPDIDQPESGEAMPMRPRQDLSTASLAEGSANSTADVAEQRSFGDQHRQDGQDKRLAPLFDQREVGELREHWTNIQAGFVDEPRRAVEDADGLVAQAMKRLAEMFAKERSGLESQWDRGDQVSTEELRVALQRYRSFFDRLLSV
jgi:hypothetical protein